jgi:hypothetical protein
LQDSDEDEEEKVAEPTAEEIEEMKFLDEIVKQNKVEIDKIKDKGFM